MSSVASSRNVSGFLTKKGQSYCTIIIGNGWHLILHPHFEAFPQREARIVQNQKC